MRVVPASGSADRPPDAARPARGTAPRPGCHDPCRLLRSVDAALAIHVFQRALTMGVLRLFIPR